MEPEPGLVSERVESDGVKDIDCWIIKRAEGMWPNLGWIFSQTNFHHIELASGATVTTLSAFDPNDPPVRVWFRG